MKNDEQKISLSYAIYLASRQLRFGIESIESIDSIKSIDAKVLQALLDEINRLHRKYPEEECERLC